MKLRTFVRYDGKNKMVRGSAILAKKAPDVGNWEEILFKTDYSSSSRDHGMLAYIAYDKNNNFLPASNILVKKKPKTGRWKQIGGKVSDLKVLQPSLFITFEDSNEPITFEDGEINLQFE